MNFIVHGTYNPASSRFEFWGEGEPIVRRKTGRLPKVARHPFAMGMQQLGEWLLKLVPHAEPEPITTTIWLPSSETAPQPSPEFAAMGVIEQGEFEHIAIKPWTVDGITFNLSDTLDLLLALSGSATVQAGADLLYWRKAALYALSLIAAQRVMPALEKHGLQLSASWKPEFTEDFPALAKLMPPISRAICNELDTAPVASALLEAFIDFTVDAVVRQAAAKAGLRYPTTAGGKWLNALTSEKDSRLSLKGAEADRLFNEWQTWIGQANVAGNSAFRITFRLDAPEDLQHHWKLNYLLQATDDPSLLIAAGQVWRGDAAAYLQQRFDQPQERLLGGLGFAARLFPPIEASLRGIAPQEANLSTDQAYTFLREVAPLLQRSGFGVLLPRWWGGKAANLTAKAKLKTGRTTGKSLLTMETLVNYEWQVILGGEPITREEFEALAALKQPLVMVRGKWVALDAEQVDAALKFFDQRSGNTTLEEALKLGLDGEEAAEAGIPIQAIDASGWLKSLFDSLKHPDKIETILPPIALQGKLRPYQLRGYSWLAFLRRFGLGACLADDMGLGKAEPLDSKVLTPRGWKFMGDIRVGDEVINSQGKTSCVVGVYPQGELDIYRVTLSDGSSVECSDDHLWAVNSPVRKMRGNPPLVLPLSEIRQRLKDAANNARYYIPMVKPVEFIKCHLPLHPYLLGLLIGDGGLSHGVHFTTADYETLTRVKELLPAGVEIKHRVGSKYDYRIISKHSGAHNPVLSILRDLGLIGCKSADKFIPETYRFASVSSRIALLQGLLDTDGSVPKDNVIEYSTVSSQLVEHVRELVQSLGGIARLSSRIPKYTHLGEKRTGQLSYRLIIALPAEIQPFSLKRKAERYHPRPKYPPTRAIVDVSFVGCKPAQCIAVSAPDNLYVTDHFIVTHNTIQAVGFLLHARDVLDAQAPALIVCPTSVVGNWRRELLRFAPDLTVMIHQGADRLTGDQFAEEAHKHHAVITSFPLLARDREIITPVHWSTVILDEAQNIKNPATKQAQAARALDTESRVALTGTPVENRLSELWSIFNFLNPGYLGSEANFRKFFAGPIERINDRDAARRLKQLTGPFILRRVKTDPTIIDDLPEKLEMKVYCTLTTEQGTLYEAVVRDVMEQVEQAEAEGNAMGRRGLVLSMLLRLKQICNHPAQFLKDGSELTGRSGKLARLTEMLEEVYAEGDRALIFTQFAEMGELLHNHLRDVFYDEPLWLHGATPVKERENMIQRFQATKGPTVFLLSLKAGGVGLNLTRANHVFHFDRWWNPAVENQATDRAFRIGQTRNVQVHKFICGGTLEEKIDEMIESKRALAESIIGTDESWLTELSTDDLRNLVTLRVKEMA